MNDLGSSGRMNIQNRDARVIKQKILPIDICTVLHRHLQESVEKQTVTDHDDCIIGVFLADRWEPYQRPVFYITNGLPACGTGVTVEPLTGTFNRIVRLDRLPGENADMTFPKERIVVHTEIWVMLSNTLRRETRTL